MCWEDIVIGNKFIQNKRVLTPPTTSTLLFDHDLNRAGIFLTPPTSGRVSFSITDVAVAGRGFVLNPGDDPIFLTLAKDGNIVTRRWFMIADGFSDQTVDTWSETVTVENAIATATHVAVAGQVHRIWGFAAGYSAPQGSNTLVINAAATPVRRLRVNLILAENFTSPIVAGANELVEAVLEAGPVAVDGDCNINGDTFIPAGLGTIEVYEGIIPLASRPENNRHAARDQPVFAG